MTTKTLLFLLGICVTVNCYRNTFFLPLNDYSHNFFKSETRLIYFFLILKLNSYAARIVCVCVYKYIYYYRCYYYYYYTL